MQNSNNQPSVEDNLTPSEVRLLASELHEFKKTFLYKHFKGCQRLLFEETVAQIIDEPLKNANTLYEREGWIGEARSIRELHKWFDNLESALEKEIRELEQ